ncbi:Ig-like domain-containing protein, partial [Cellulophaga fucicola]
MSKRILFILKLFCFLFIANSYGQLSDLHYMPPLTETNQNYIINQYVYLSTPEVIPFDVNIYVGTSVTPLATVSVSNTAPYTYILPTRENGITLLPNAEVGFVSSTAGLRLEAPGGQKFYANYRGNSNSQGVSLTSKGRAALGTHFKWGGIPFLHDRPIFNAALGIMATEDNTTVTISDYDPDCVFRLGNDGTGLTDDTITITLNKGESYVLEVEGNNGDANRYGWLGADIISDKDIAISVGHILLGVLPNVNIQDGGTDQPVPIDIIGREYVFIRGGGTDALEFPIIIGTASGTDIFVNGATTPIATINDGEYFVVPGSNYSGGTAGNNMTVTTSKNVYAYQCLAGSNSGATIGMNFIAPVNCLLPDNVNNISTIEDLAGKTISGGLTILASNSTPDANIVVTADGVPVTLPAAIPATGLPWKSFYIPGLTGNIYVQSSGAIAVGVVGFSGALGTGGYFSGFDTVPVVDYSISGSGCLGSTITLTETFDTYQWYNDGVAIPGATSGSYTPTEIGEHYVNVSKSGCDYNSNVIQVFYCDPDIYINKTSDKTTISEGETVTFTITVESLGLDNTTNLVITDALPTGLTLTSATPSKGTWSAPNWNVGDLVKGEKQSLVIVATANDIVAPTAAISITNSVSNVQDQTDSNSSTDDLTEDITIENLDDDGDGDPDTTDPAPTDPCISSTNQVIANADVNWNTQDCDGDGVDNSVEITNGTDPYNPDSDGDTINDGQEASDNTDPLNDCDSLGGTPLPASDCDGDGVPNSLDVCEGFDDTINADSDALPDACDEDDDNDGIPDTIEGNTDFDGDGIPNRLDLDSDNDGIPDVVESGNGSLDTDGNGAIDASESSVGTNGIPDAAEDGGIDGSGVSTTPVNSDGIAGPDYLDIDSDNDGIQDLVEAQSDATLVQLSGNDSDNDGIDDAFDADNGGNFINLPENTDLDSYPDYLDLDSDNDGIIDNIEWQSTSGHLFPSTDTDGNGLADNYETSAGSGESINQPENSDGHDGPDFRDTDSDGDLLDDIVEVYGSTTLSGTDADNDGLDDAFDLSIVTPNGLQDPNGATNNNQDVTGFLNTQDPFTSEVDFRDANVHRDPIDTDGDGVDNLIDIDNDNDGILDYVESLGFQPKDIIDNNCGIPAGSFIGGTYISSTGSGAGTVGAEYRFSTVVTSSLGVLDAIVRITDIDNATLTSIDAFPVDSSNEAWQPTFDVGGTTGAKGSMSFNIRLVATGTNFQVNLIRFGGVIYDIDGANTKESVTLTRPGLYAVDSNSLLTVSENLATGTATFEGPEQTWAGVDFGPRLAAYFNYYETTNLDITFTGELLNNSGSKDYLGSVLFQTCDINGLFTPTNTTSATNSDGIPLGSVASGPGTAPVYTIYQGIDSDNDGIEDHLDIDSDNDGIPDNVEAQLTSSYTPRGVDDSDGDGLGNPYEGSGNEGLTAIDTDSDGIPDYLDLDSDNDGFTDRVEAGFTLATNNLDNDNDGLLNDYDDVDTPGTLFDTNDDQDNGASDLPNIAKNTTAEVDYREVGIDDNDLDGIADSVDKDDDNDGILDTLETSGTDPSADDDSDGDLNYQDTDLGADANGDGIVDIFDTDNDGVPNHFDLDTDNDGIYDVVESGSGQAYTAGILDGAVGTDGVPNTVQASGQQNSGTINYTVSDSETVPDGIADFLELDADGDGCNDVTEAGYTDSDGDGYLGDSPTLVNPNGIVTGTNVTNGYTTTNNLDSATNTVFDFQQPGVAPTIATAAEQPQDVLTNASSPETFTVTATGTELIYQWQVDDQLGGGFVDIDDANTSDIYTGNTSPTLTLTGITVAQDGYQYRVIVSELSYVCSPITSTTALLTVDVIPPTEPTVQDQITNDTTPVLTGTAEPNSTVTVEIDDTGVIYTTIADASGNWTIDTETATPTSGTYTPPITDRTYDIEVTSTDEAGNSTGDLTSLELTIDITAPVIPTVNSQVTNDTTPVLTGTAEANSTITVVVGGATYTTTADASGNWTIDTETATPDSGTFNPNVNGTNEVLVTSTDQAGNSTNDATTLELT